MPTLPIRLEWHLDSKGYRLVDHDRVIVANGGKLKHTRPLDGIDGLYKVFSNVWTPDGLLKFVEVHGLLHDHSYKAPWMAAVLEKKAGEDSPLGRYSRQLARASVNEPKRESVSEHLRTAELFRRIMLQAQVGWRRVPRALRLELSMRFSRTSLGEIRLGDDIDRGFRLTFTANTLMDGLWLQLAANISGGAAFRLCARCGKLFETGLRTGRRADSKFCSDAHRIEFNSRKRSKKPIPAVPARQRVK
jgi:hypothetical protein